MWMVYCSFPLPRVDNVNDGPFFRTLTKAILSRPQQGHQDAFKELNPLLGR